MPDQPVLVSHQPVPLPDQPVLVPDQPDLESTPGSCRRREIPAGAGEISLRGAVVRAALHATGSACAAPCGAYKKNMSGHRKTLEATIEALGPLYEILLERPLDLKQRKSTGATLFATAPRVVKLVAQALGADPALFSDIQEDAGALLGDQSDADVLRRLRGHLALLTVLCGDTHLVVQSEALRRALHVYRQVLDGDPYKYAADDRSRWLREALMRRADPYLPWRGKKGGAKKHRRLRPRRRMKGMW